jgi:hypothetical protein
MRFEWLALALLLPSAGRAQWPPSHDEAQAAFCYGVMVIVEQHVLAWPAKDRAGVDLLILGREPGYASYLQSITNEKNYYLKAMGIGPGRMEPIRQGQEDEIVCTARFKEHPPQCETVGWCTENPDALSHR